MANMKTTLLAAGLSAFLLSSCGASNPSKPSSAQPGWVLNPPRSAAVVYGTGSAEIYTSVGEAKDRAKDNARFQLVSNLSVTISGDSLSKQKSWQAGSGANSKSAFVSSFESAVRSKIPEVQLAGLTIAEYYHSEKERTVYALATLDRAAAIADLNNQIDRVEAELASINNANMSSNTLDKLRVLLPALELFQQHELLNEKLRLISENKQERLLSAELTSIQDRIYNELDQLTIVISGAPELQDGLSQALTDIGFRVSRGGAADLRLEYTVSWRNLERNNTVFAVADASVKIIDDQMRTLSVLKQSAKGGSADVVLARNKAMDQLAKQLSEQLAENLVKLID